MTLYDIDLFTYHQIRNALEMIQRGENVRFEVSNSTCMSFMQFLYCSVKKTKMAKST